MKKLDVIAMVALALGAGGALAHGDEVRAETQRHGASVVEDTAFGRQGDPKAVNRTVEIVASDAMRFKPDLVRIERGQTVRFIVRNAGHLLHEMVLGTADALEEHAALMRRYPHMEHADPNMTRVKPGAKGQIVWQFTQAGEFRFACLQRGHFEAGMIGTVVVK